jgi:hypothetical protein
LRILAFDEGNVGSFYDYLEELGSVGVQSLDCIQYTLAASEALAVDNPYLHSALYVCIILKIVHFSNRLKANSVKTAFNYD